MSGTSKLTTKQLAFYTHKPKSLRLAEDMQLGCTKANYDFKIMKAGSTPLPNTVGLFYGVVPETYATFRYYMAEGRAVYLDNGWFSTQGKPTFRFSWNSVQPHLQDLTPLANINAFPDLPPIERWPQTNRALLILQSPQYFENLRLPYTRDQWQRSVTKVLKMKGYTVETREKPRNKNQGGPSFFEQIARAGIVVSLNSAACVKAIRYGIPAFCTLDCTMSPYAPVKLPQVGMAAPPSKQEAQHFLRRLASYEITREEMRAGQAINSILKINNQKRRGYWYGS